MPDRPSTIFVFKTTLIYGFLLVLGVAGCSDDECGPGFVQVGAACIEQTADGGSESCNGLDDDMDGEVDETDPSAGTPCGTGVGVCTIGVLACIGGELACNGATGSEETCNAIDDDCDGMVDESLSMTFYLDADMDGFGGNESVCEACEASLCPGEGPWVLGGGDCNDACDFCSTESVEVCDSLDNDCDGNIDERVQTWVYRDGDGDGFGAGEAMLTCLDEDGFPPPGFVLEDGDCADEDARANPDATMMFTTRIRGVADVSVDFDFDCDGREERLHDPCPSCRNARCWQPVSDPPRDGDPPCGTTGRAQQSNLFDPPGAAEPFCLRSDSYEDQEVACR